MLHGFFGKHQPNLETSHWEQGHFVTQCTTCGRPMVKLPGLPWRLRDTAD